MNAKPKRYISIDFETANSERLSACALGLALVEDGAVSDTFATLLKPPPEVDHFAPMNVRIHGITPDMVENAPTFDTLYPKLRQLADGAPLLGYSKFDRSVLMYLATYYGLPISQERFADYIDVCSLAKVALPQLKNHKLKTLANYFDLGDFRHHDAAEDAKMCARVFLALLECSELPQACQPKAVEKPHQPTRAEISAAFDGFADVILEDGVIDYKEAIELRHFLSAIPQSAGVRELKLTVDDFLEDGQIDDDESRMLVELICNVSADLSGQPCVPCPECSAPIRRESLAGLTSCPWCDTPLNF